jgi:cysteine synthase A
LARVEGIFAGISTGANLAAVARLAERRENVGKTFATVAPDAATLPQAPEFFDDGLQKNVRRL